MRTFLSPFYWTQSCTNAEDQFFSSLVSHTYFNFFLSFKSLLLVDSNNRCEEPWVPGYQVCEDKLKPKYICNRTVIADSLTEKLHIVLKYSKIYPTLTLSYTPLSSTCLTFYRSLDSGLTACPIIYNHVKAESDPHSHNLVSTVKFHFVTIKHVVMFFKLQFSCQQLEFILKIVKTLVSISQSYPAIWKSCVWILLIYNQLMLPSPLPFHLEIVSRKIHQRTLFLMRFFLVVCLCNMHNKLQRFLNLRYWSSGGET